jgi:hypothetical protein
MAVHLALGSSENTWLQRQWWQASKMGGAWRGVARFRERYSHLRLLQSELCEPAALIL